MQRTQFLNIFVLVVILLMGFGLIVPIMPFFAAQYGANELMVGLIVATYAAGQFLGAPLVGRLSDRMGRRPMLALTMAGTVLSFLLLGLAEILGKQYLLAFPAESAAENTQHLNAVVLGVTFFTRLLGGLSGGSITVAQAYIADITDESGKSYPPTAQLAERSAEHAAAMILADLGGKKRSAFHYRPGGIMIALGGDYGAGILPGGIKVRGYLAYLIKKAIFHLYTAPLRRRSLIGKRR